MCFSVAPPPPPRAPVSELLEMAGDLSHRGTTPFVPVQSDPEAHPGSRLVEHGS